MLAVIALVAMILLVTLALRRRLIPERRPPSVTDIAPIGTVLHSPRSAVMVDGRSLPEWMAELNERALLRRTAAANAIGAMGPAARGALPTLWALGKHRDRELAEAALTAVMRLAPTHDERVLARETLERRFY
jgi:hypothetical protein